MQGLRCCPHPQGRGPGWGGVQAGRGLSAPSDVAVSSAPAAAFASRSGPSCSAAASSLAAAASATVAAASEPSPPHLAEVREADAEDVAVMELGRLARQLAEYQRKVRGRGEEVGNGEGGRVEEGEVGGGCGCNVTRGE